MILGIEIALLIMGILALVRGRLQITGSKIVTGIPARVLGLLALTPLPIVIAVAMGYTIMNSMDKTPEQIEQWANDNKTTFVIMEAVIVLGIAALLFTISLIIAKPPEDQDVKPSKMYDRQGRRKRNDDEEADDENEDDDRPRKKGWRDE